MRKLALLLIILLVNTLVWAEKPQGMTLTGVQEYCPAFPSLPYSSILHPGQDASTVRSVQDTSVLNQLYYNGRIWTGKYFTVYGTEFIIEDAWQRADIIINGIQFNNVALKYDIYNDEVLANYYDKRIIILNNENIECFTLYINGRDLLFKNIKNIRGLSGHYQVIYEGKSKLYKKWKKKRAQFVVEARYDEFQDDHALIVVKGDGSYDIKNRRNFLGLMNDKKSEIKRFIRHQNIRLDFNNPESLVPVLKYYESI